MIGRFSQADVYRELVRSQDFLRVLSAGALAAASFLSDLGAEPSLVGTGLALASVALNGVPIVWGALRGVWARRVNVDELVAIAIVACLVQGEFLTAAVVSFVMVLGALLEEATTASARNAIRSLVELSPDTATVLVDGAEREVPLSAIGVGDRIRVRPGERVPVDAVVCRGVTAVDEAPVTGEPLPREVSPGGTVYAGTLNQTGVIELEAQRVGEDTTLGKVIRLVTEAENHKPEAIRLIDGYARWFTPAILACAGLTWAATGEMSRAVTVLIVGCPCALILAAPTAIVASLGRAARAGILVKGGHFLEEVGRATVILFDKTGTLTEGRPRLAHVVPSAGIDAGEVLHLAACVERHSTHPLARAVLVAAAEQNLALCDVDEGATEIGVGVHGRVGGHWIEVLNADRVPALPPELDGSLARHRKEGQTVLAVLRDGVPLGLLTVADTVRPEAPATVEHLRSLGFGHVGILSGDHETSARLVADFVGVTDAWSALKPHDKLTITRDEQARHGPVIFVGDGINDAPALAAANVGIAMGAAGTHVALETADVALMNDDLKRLPFLVELSRAMRRRILWNVAIGMGFNAFAVLAGAAGLFDPIAGALVHNFGSVLVVLSSASLAFTPVPGAQPGSGDSPGPEAITAATPTAR